ncbi:MAG: hypothetical protein LBJ12_02050 [Oscillospiraceae bacterium]|nr:hypothetical protein [Oscillospiraceae bacterium]
MKRLLATLIVLTLFAACVSGDDYLNAFTFIRRWNSFDAVKKNESLHIEENKLWHDDCGDYEEYAVFFAGDEYMMRLLCKKTTEYIHLASLTGLYANGKFTEKQEKAFYELVCLMISAMCGLEAMEAANLLKCGCLDKPEAAHYYEQGFYSYSSIEDGLGVTFKIVNLRLSPKEIPELTLMPTTMPLTNTSQTTAAP